MIDHNSKMWSALSTAARFHLVVSNSSLRFSQLTRATAVCDVGCRALVSFPDDEIIGNFNCDVQLVRGSEPYAIISDSVQRALLQRSFVPIEVKGRFRTNSFVDGWYAACGTTEFVSDMLLDGPIDCDSILPWLCLCPLRSKAETHPIKIRTSNVNLGIGRLGYRNGTFTVYEAGTYLVNSATNRTYRAFQINDIVSGVDAMEMVHARNQTFMQINENGEVDYEIGAAFQWNGSHLVIPWSGTWEVVPYDGSRVTFLQKMKGEAVKIMSRFFIREVYAN